MVCSSIINAVLVASYDQAKEKALAAGFTDSMSTHFLCAFIASSMAALAGNPTDVIKTRSIIKNRGDPTNPTTYTQMAK